MELKALSLSDLEIVRQWRNEQIEMLRTPFLLTQEMQEKFYHDVICNRQPNSRYWGIWIEKENTFIGMCGLENTQWENRLSEISLIFNPTIFIDYTERETALYLLLNEGFNNMNIDNIYTEVYECNPHKNFWIDAYTNYKDNEQLTIPVLPNRKYYNGKYYNSLYINFNKERFNENIIS